MRQIKDFLRIAGTIPGDLPALDRSDCDGKELFEREQPIGRPTLVIRIITRTIVVPILKYTFVVGSSLLALILVAGHVMEPAPGTISKPSTSLEVLRKMANHGELRPFASAATAGSFLPMSAVVEQPVLATADTLDVTKSANVSVVSPPTLLDAQARLRETDVVDKPARLQKKVASRKPKQQPRSVYVENIPRGPSGFFGAFQSW